MIQRRKNFAVNLNSMVIQRNDLHLLYDELTFLQEISRVFELLRISKGSRADTVSLNLNGKRK